MSKRTPHCPTCKKPVKNIEHNPTFPFCSGQCKLVDLGNWLDGRYRVASEAPFSEGERDLPESDPEENER